MVEVFALRKLRPRTSGRNKRAERTRSEVLRRWTRRWFSQRKNHHLQRDFQFVGIQAKCTQWSLGEKLFLASAGHRPKLNTRPIPAFFQVVPGRTPYPSDAVTMNTVIEEQLTPESNDVCTIVVLYDGDATRARALSACDFLVKQFWKDVELEFHWWREDFLRDETLATVASANAVASDFLIVCLESHREISPALESWFENWVAERRDREGALVDLTDNSGATQELTMIQTFLREVSQRGNFDYLTAIPGDGGSPKAESQPQKEYFQRIDDILREPRPPSHFGLNE